MMDESANAYYQLACLILYRIISAARSGNLSARIFLMCEDGEGWMESVNLEPEAVREALVAKWIERAREKLA